MHVAGRHNGLAQFVRNRNDLSVDIFNILHTGDFIKFLVLFGIFGVRVGMRRNHKAVVARRLNFQIIVKRGDFQNFLFGAFLQNRAIQFPRLARRADN